MSCEDCCGRAHQGRRRRREGVQSGGGGLRRYSPPPSPLPFDDDYGSRRVTLLRLRSSNAAAMRLGWSPPPLLPCAWMEWGERSGGERRRGLPSRFCFTYPGRTKLFFLVPIQVAFLVVVDVGRRSRLESTERNILPPSSLFSSPIPMGRKRKEMVWDTGFEEKRKET